MRGPTSWRGVVLLLMVALVACSSSAVPLTLTPSLPPPPTATPLPTATPTPSPADYLGRAEAALFNGDWDAAAAAYDDAAASGDPSAAEEAEFGKARLLLESGQSDAARSAFDFFLISHPDGERAAQAHLLRGRLRRDAGDAAGAVEDFDAYLAQRPGLIDGYVQEWAGDALWNASQPEAAADRYASAASLARLDNGVGVRFKQGRALVDAGDTTTALAIYDDLYNGSIDPAVRAAADWWSGQALEATGDKGGAFARYLDAVNNYPETNESYQALVELVNADVPVDDMLRGRIDVYAGAYAPAVSAYSRVLEARPSSAVYYQRALARRGAGDPSGALDDLFQVYAVYTDAPEAEAAWMEAADIAWFDLGDARQAIALYSQFVETLPTAGRAAEALVSAGRAAETSGDLPGAADLYTRAAASYPSSDRASGAALRAGLAQYRLGDQTAASASFQKAGELAQSGADRAAAAFWSAKVLAAEGKAEESRQALASAAASDPTGFYSERAADRLAGRAPFDSGGIFTFPSDLGPDRAQAEAWLRATFPITATDDLSRLSDSLANDPRQVRGTELLSLGLYDQARAEFEAMRQDYAGDAEATYRLMHRFLALGLFDLAIRSSRQILDLAGLDDAGTFSAPRYFNRIRFGPYFGDLILPAALEAGFDPLFLLSVVRQESLFQGSATSVASARGLMQVIPSTGAAIAAELGWPPNYSEADLHRPIVSVRFGTHYLQQQRDYFDGNLMAALAAYNGGPGNAAAWLERAGGDPDLFYEVVGYEETRTYLRTIYEVFNIYRNLYAGS